MKTLEEVLKSDLVLAKILKAIKDNKKEEIVYGILEDYDLENHDLEEILK